MNPVPWWKKMSFYKALSALVLAVGAFICGAAGGGEAIANALRALLTMFGGPESGVPQ